MRNKCYTCNKVFKCTFCDDNPELKVQSLTTKIFWFAGNILVMLVTLIAVSLIALLPIILILLSEMCLYG